MADMIAVRNEQWGFIVVIGGQSATAAERRRYAKKHLRPGEILDRGYPTEHGGTAYNIWEK